MNHVEAMKLALEVVEQGSVDHLTHLQREKLIAALRTALRAAIEQAEKQEPVAVIRTWHKMGEQHAELWNWHTGLDALPDGKHTLYTTPQPQREWVGLTDEEIQQVFIANSVMVDNGNTYMVAGLRAVNIGRAIEAKLKEKNT